METPTRQFVFQRVYDMAALIEACVEDEGSLYELDWDDPEVVAGLVKFNRITLLHRCIYVMSAIKHRREYRKNADFYEAEQISEIEALFDAYGITLLPHADFAARCLAEREALDPDEIFYEWFLSQESEFELLWEKLTEETFHLLFANRAFLLNFNRAVASYLREGPPSISSEYLGSEGRIRRQSLPVWVRQAVFYRDHGRCVLCQVDLSGLLSTDRVDHFDHMVPLAEWGTNDPCNIQLLCGACNLRKAAGEPVTGNRYSAWWRY